MATPEGEKEAGRREGHGDFQEEGRGKAGGKREASSSKSLWGPLVLKSLCAFDTVLSLGWMKTLTEEWQKHFSFPQLPHRQYVLFPEITII